MSRFESLRSNNNNNNGAPIKRVDSTQSVPVARKQSAFRSRDKDNSRGGDYSSFRKKENNFQKHHSHDGAYKPGFASKNPAPANNELNFPTLSSTVETTTKEVKPPKLTYVGASKTAAKQEETTLPKGWIQLTANNKPAAHKPKHAISMMDQLQAWVENIPDVVVCAYLDYLDQRDKEYREANDNIFQELYIDGWKAYPQNEKYLFYQGMYDSDLEENEDSDSEDSIGGRGRVNTGVEMYTGSRNYDVN